ncbi:HTH-type transcriptional regulator BenM (plasmid) [Sulfitobacter indolifex]|uniref:Transcriptional regulator, LysR family protein n=1 Tax=Sulfitobacter indolifex HEL-45 TaxID=391624 RepID=A0ABP2D6Y3_9RHOB|nr:LysR family transcriptional regulator [Sulfitobacter indolifex]EDQ03473.1 putative transcriptional regulator, LysR family protein [Sulfitobacter indolifex HEL-45]UOA20604.1 HTH-type transcriptional regulator BenM [Sulfitobacter indolifex]UOA20827.1 HTH-type transcriptional regulator BenM [Sulfitobacter indolifex]
MDITLIKTFIEVANTGSFVAARDRLFVTQSAISLRIQRLEGSLGHQLFTRSKAGAVLTAEGQQFEPYALSLLKVWEEARQKIQFLMAMSVRLASAHNIRSGRVWGFAGSMPYRSRCRN